MCYSLARKAGVKKDIQVVFYRGHYKDLKEDVLIGRAFADFDPFLVDCLIDIDITYPYKIRNKYTTKTVGPITLFSQEDLIKYLVAHEFCHGTHGHHDNFRLPMGGVDKHAMELCCDSFALAATGIKN
jgi:hypothetical protein